MSYAFHSRKAILPLIKKWQNEGLSIGFTSGAFDLLHPGHVKYLERAAKKCERLIVGINTDESIRAYKDPRRPIVGERDRLQIVAALASVSGAFLFSETTNRENILAIKPNYYIKGADYSSKKSSKTSSGKKTNLTSAPLLKAWGGRVITIPLVKGKSTSSLIDTVLTRYHDTLPKVVRVVPLKSSNLKTQKIAKLKKTPAVFFDRDGVINQEVEYLHDPKEFRLIPGVLEALKLFSAQGYKIIIVTNQTGIGLGYFTKADFFKVNKKMLGLFAQAGVVVDKVYYCPHGVRVGCRCRKPGTSMIEQAVLDEELDLKGSIMMGDRLSDIECGNKMGLTTVLVRTGHGKIELKKLAQLTSDQSVKAKKTKHLAIQLVTPTHIAGNALEATKWFLGKPKPTRVSHK